jgi:hypothetical protein
MKVLGLTSLKCIAVLDYMFINLLYCIYYYQGVTGVIKPIGVRWAGHIACMGKKRIAYIVLVGKLEGKRQLGRHRRIWEDNIKMYLREIGWDGVD